MVQQFQYQQLVHMANAVGSKTAILYPISLATNAIILPSWPQ